MDYKQVRARFIAASVLAFALPIEVFAMTHTAGNLESEATVQRAPAEIAALSQVPNGTIRSGKLERTHGKIVWAFDVATPQSVKDAKILIDAKNGKILSSGIEGSHHHRHHMKQARADMRSAH